MVRGVVTSAADNYMTIKGLEFKSGRKYDTELRVRNDPDLFELLPKVNNKASEDTVLSIKVTAAKDSEQVCAMLRVKDRMYAAYAVCSPDDEFDLRQGAAIAISRVLDLMDEKAKETKTPDGPVKIGNLVRITCSVSGGLKAGDLAEVIGIGPRMSYTGKHMIYVAAKTTSCFDGSECRYPGPGTLKQPFSYLGTAEYEILTSQPVRAGKEGE